MLLKKTRSLFFVVGIVVAFMIGRATIPHGHQRTQLLTTIKPTSSENPVMQRLDVDKLSVPPQLAEKLGLQFVVAQAPANPVSLPCVYGVLALDSDHLSRIHTRFSGEVVEIASNPAPSLGSTTLRVGDWVTKGDLLAVVWSAELGTKKSELASALAMLRSEEALRDRLKKLFEEGAAAGRSYRDADVAVQTRLAEVTKIEMTLRTWRLSEQDLSNIKQEAERLVESQAPLVKSNHWARVEVRAPTSGVILEKNVTVGDIVDTTTDLFKICDTTHLVVWAHVYEEDLPLFQGLPRPLPWTITVPSMQGSTRQYSGALDRISSVIDPAQHTALIGGHVDNSLGELKVGQFVTVHLQVPSRSDVLELPATAVVEDGRNSFVFMSTDDDPLTLIRKPVRVLRRGRDKVFIHADSSSVHAGTIVVATKTLMIQIIMEQQPVMAVNANVVASTVAEPRALAPTVY